MASVSQQQDQFKLKTLQAMAAGTGNPYTDAQSNVNQAEQDALKAQSGDAGKIPAGGPASDPQGRIVGDINSSVTGSGDAVQDYLGTMSDAQSKWDNTFREASAGYAPPPIYTSTGSSGGGGGGLSADDLAINPQLYPEGLGGGFLHGGMRSQSQANAFVRGLAEAYDTKMKAQDQALNEQAQRYNEGQRKSAYMAQGQHARELDALMSKQQERRGNRLAYAAQLTPDERAATPYRIPGITPAPPPDDRSMMLLRPEKRIPQGAFVRTPYQGQATDQKIVELDRQKAIDEYLARVTDQKQAALTQAADAYTVPEEYLLQRQAAAAIQMNPYEAMGTYQAPTFEQRNADLSAELQYRQRQENHGATLPELNAYDQALAQQTWGPQVIKDAARYRLSPEEFIQAGSGPEFQNGLDVATDEYENQNGDIRSIEERLRKDTTLAPTQIQMILDQYRGLGR